MDLEAISKDVKTAAEALMREASYSRAGDIFVLGCSSSEVQGESIGQATSQKIGEVIVVALAEVVCKHGFALAVQGCEHINRALVVERTTMEKYQLEEVNVVPQLNAGGSAAVAAWSLFADPVCVEHLEATLGFDIGDTEIGMHIKHVQRPVRLPIKLIGQARLTSLMYRPKLIGGDRSRHA